MPNALLLLLLLLETLWGPEAPKKDMSLSFPAPQVCSLAVELSLVVMYYWLGMSEVGSSTIVQFLKLSQTDKLEELC